MIEAGGDADRFGASRESNRVVAAVDGGPATGPVIDVGRALAGRLGAELDVVSVGEQGVESLTTHAVRYLEGDPAAVLVHESERSEVLAIVVGTRQCEGSRFPAGSVTRTLLERAPSLVVAVPPDLSRSARSLARIVLPITGDSPPSMAGEDLVGSLVRSGSEFLPLHVLDRDHVPAFLERWDDLELYAEEFAHRHVTIDEPVAIRAGDPVGAVLEFAAEHHADGALVEWSQDLAPTRAHLVRGLLERCHCPILLLPTTAKSGPGRAAAELSDTPTEDDRPERNR